MTDDLNQHRKYMLLPVMVPAVMILAGVLAVVVLQVFNPGDNTVVIGMIFTALAAATPGVIAAIKIFEQTANIQTLSTEVVTLKENVDGKMEKLLQTTERASFANGRAQSAVESSLEAARLAKETAELAVVAGDKARETVPAKSNAPDIPAEIKIVNEPDSPVPTIPGTEKENRP